VQSGLPEHFEPPPKGKRIMKRTHQAATAVAMALGLGLAATGAAASPMEGGMGHGHKMEGKGHGHGMEGKGHGHGMEGKGHGHRGGSGPMAQLMTPEERTAMHEKMRNAATPEERQALREANRAEMQKRAAEKGITLPERGAGRHGGKRDR
jgi:hypothetical protein